MKKVLLLFLSIIMIGFTSCSKDEESETTTTNSSSSSSQTKTKTEVIITVTNPQGQTKSGYIVVMFKKEFDPKQAFDSNDIIKEVVSDNNGVAKFDLDNLVLNKVTYYFEVFSKNNNGDYILESIIRKKLDISKNQSIKTSIVIK